MFGSKNNSVGVIGLGIIGSRVAERLRNADLNVYVWNRSIKPEPNFMASPAEVAEVAQVIQIFVRDAEALVAVMEDMKAALTPDHVVLCHSTVNSWGIRRAVAIAESTGAAFLDAPFTGSKAAAENGQLVYYIGGDQAPLERARKVLETSGRKIITLGKAGDATVLKIATNLISAAVVEALAEAMAITKAEGIDVSKLQEALADNANSSALLTMKLPTMAARSYAPHFSLKNMLKDARYAQAIADEKGLALPVLNASAQAMDRGVRSGQGDFDYSVVLENYAPMLRAVEERAARIKAKEAAAVPPPAPADPTPTAEALAPGAEKAKADATDAEEASKAQPAGEPAAIDKAKTSTHTKLVPASVSADSPPSDKKDEGAKNKISPETGTATPDAKTEAVQTPEKKDVTESKDAGTTPAETQDKEKDKDAPEARAQADAPADTKAEEKGDAEKGPQAAKGDAEKKPEADAPTASGLPKPPTIAKAGLKPSAPGSDKPEAAAEGKVADGAGTAAKPEKPDPTTPKGDATPVVKQPSFVSRLFRGITGRGKKDRQDPTSPPAVKAFKTAEPASGTGPTPPAPAITGQDKEKDKDKDLAKKKEKEPGKEKDKTSASSPTTGKTAGGSLAAVLATESKEAKAPATDPAPPVLPATKLPPPPIRPVKPLRPKLPAAPATTLVAKLLSDTDVDDDDDDPDEPVAIATAAVPADDKEKEKTSPATGAPVDASEEKAAPAPAVTGATSVPAGSPAVNVPVSEPALAEAGPAPADEKPGQAESATEAPKEPVADAPPVAEPAPAPLPVFDESKSLEDITREVNAKLSAFPKIPERTAPILPESEEPAAAPAPSAPPQTRLEGTRGFIVPNLAPAPPAPTPVTAVESTDEASPTAPSGKIKFSRKRAPAQPDKTEPDASAPSEAAVPADHEAPPQA